MGESICQRHQIAPDLVKVSLDPGPDYRAAWLDVPGGFVTFNLPLTPRLKRSYSLVSAPHDPYACRVLLTRTRSPLTSHAYMTTG